MPRVKKTKLTARQRGYFHKAEVAASLRAMAALIDRSNDTSLMKTTWNIWYTPDDELETVDATNCQDDCHYVEDGG